MKIGIAGIECYLPPKTEDGATLKRDNPDWRIEDIEAKTGIRLRHIAAADETAADMACRAGEMLFASGVSRDQVDLLILVTQSPDYLLPTSACILQHRLGLSTACMAFDVNLGCSGFVYALALAGSMIHSGLARQALILCSETYSKFIDPADRTCRPLFSDGAAAVLIGPDPHAELGPFEMGTDGAGFRSLILPLSAARPRSSPSEERKLCMSGADVFMFTMDKVPQCAAALLAKAGKTIADIDLFVFHQASQLVLDNIVRRMDLPPEKAYSNLARVGNTVSASIPIALRDAAAEGRLVENHLVMLLGFGVGLSWGGCLLRWGQWK